MATYINSADDFLQLRKSRGMFMVGGDSYAVLAGYIRGALAANDQLMSGWDLFVPFKLGASFSVAVEYEIVRPMGEDLMRILVAGGGTSDQNEEAINRLLDLIEAYVDAEKSGELEQVLKDASASRSAI